MTTDDNAISEIRKGLDLLFEKGDVVELRVPRDPSSTWSANISGFFDDLSKLAEAIHEVNTRYSRTVYVTMNPLAQEWMGVNNVWYRGSSKLKKELDAANQSRTPRMKEGWKHGKQYFTRRMAKDDDVLFRRWILIDIDAGQPAGMNSSNAEKADALRMATEVILYLEGHGFPPPALTNSGNGYHVYVRIDFENSLEMKALVRRFLKALGQRFNGTRGTALVDEGMYNAARITKATGSFVFKGVNTPLRPQRRSGVVSVGSNLTASLEQVQTIATEYALAQGETFSLAEGVDVVVDDEKLRMQVTILKRYLDRNKIKSGAATREGNGAITLLCVCPNAATHTTNVEGGTVAVVRPSGAFGFCCQHAHCQELQSWKGFRKFVDARYARTNPNEQPFQWSVGTVILTDIQVVEHKPLSKKARVRAARVKANTERLAPVRAANPNVLFGENYDTKVQAQWLLEKLCNPSCSVKDANERAAELGISKWTLRQSYPTAGVITSYADRRGARLVKAATLAEANKLAAQMMNTSIYEYSSESTIVY